MKRDELFREVVGFVAIVLAASFAAVLMMAAGSCLVGGREQGLSEVMTETARAYSDPALVPAPVWAASQDACSAGLCGLDSGEDGGTALLHIPASTVTQSALTVIDPVPATPVASARPVETIAPKSDISALIAASPWPQSLWGTVACLVQRESRGVATAVGGAGERGLMQIHPATWAYLAQYGITPDALFDPATNLRAGYLLYLEAGSLRPWNGGCA